MVAKGILTEAAALATAEVEAGEMAMEVVVKGVAAMARAVVATVMDTPVVVVMAVVVKAAEPMEGYTVQLSK